MRTKLWKILLLVIVVIAVPVLYYIMENGYSDSVHLEKVNRPSGSGLAVFYHETTLTDTTLALFVNDPSAAKPIVYLGYIDFPDYRSRLNLVFWSKDGSLLIISRNSKRTAFLPQSKGYDFLTHTILLGPTNQILRQRGGPGQEAYGHGGGLMPARLRELNLYRLDN